MESTEDDDVKFVRASNNLVANIYGLLKRILWKAKDASGRVRVHRVVRERDLVRLLQSVEPFQEDPQLLDSHLKDFIPQLASSYLESLKHHLIDIPKSGNLTLSTAVARILYTFCKVRGEKVIVGFFDNEPRFLEPLLLATERAFEDDQQPASKAKVSWEERYILLIWLSHLLLTPFDLASISSFELEQDDEETLGIALPGNLPGITMRILPICLRSIRVATKERNAAATLLVRLCLRPDMRKVGLLDSMALWALGFFKPIASRDSPELHRGLGILSFLSGLVASGNVQEIGHFLPRIFEAILTVTKQESLAFLQSSAVARKLTIKIFRNVVIHSLQKEISHLDTGMVLEEAVGVLLEALGDGDSPVRTAASKSLSLITFQLDQSMSGEIIEALLAALDEDVLWDGSQRNLSVVNPRRWHGLTLTLAYLLFRRAIPSQQLTAVLNALLLGLNFEQRSATGSSIGTNVRDSANFGIWALSRRYTTAELLSVETSSIRATHKNSHVLSVTQMLAIELLQSACLDPAGNIRRGSSAALQELIGRHPNTIVEGIALVQTVDYHAVGLRERATTEVAIQAAKLDGLYWDSLFNALGGWRGVGSADARSRISAGRALGKLSSLKQFDAFKPLFSQLVSQHIKISRTRNLPTEDWHGSTFALAFIIKSTIQQAEKTLSKGDGRKSMVAPWTIGIFHTVALMNVEFGYLMPQSDGNFTDPTLRPELVATAALSLIAARCEAIRLYSYFAPGQTAMYEELPKMKLAFDLSLRRAEQPVLDLVPEAVNQYTSFSEERSPEQDFAHEWLVLLSRESKTGNRLPGIVLALGAIYPQIHRTGRNDKQTLETITRRCTSEVDVEARVVALQSLVLITQELTGIKSEALGSVTEKIASTVSAALDDYTINERGDVGSLVRLQALEVVEVMWARRLKTSKMMLEKMTSSVVRLALEKLDKVRARASKCLQEHPDGSDFRFSSAIDIHDVSMPDYFLSAISLFYNSISSIWLRRAIVEGYCSSAGMGSESIVQGARLAFCQFSEHISAFKSKQQFVFDFVSDIVELMKANIGNDRVLVPLIEMVAFLFDSRVLQILEGSKDFKWRNLLSAIQKSHYKSSNMHKLLVVIDVYRGLSEIEIVAKEVESKVRSMLLHPFPKVRVAAAETLFLISNLQELKAYDWNRPTTQLKEVVAKISF